jgi:metal-responsive CopG/Arc/MetJ family transcriptional regulator
VAKPKKHQNRELMERISISIPKQLLRNVDNHVQVFAKGEVSKNRAKYICNLLDKYTPIAIDLS